ncbi:hypothetical protein [Paraburkholderia sp. J11-2]|uniref:hypothetical protein n=1 Tax=Paraburkholderia sp. J11-2 TaxID=2805431 RepID=UPI002AB6270D|nr:hypothetical protein [Paraburkholderia sp. J11-2]
MGAPDLSSWLWPDASQGRAPNQPVNLDRSNPLLAGLADYILPADASTYSVASGTLARTIDPLGQAFKGTMRLDGRKNAVITSAPYTLICVTRLPATLSGTLVACSLEGSFTSSDTPWMGYNTGEGVAVSNSQTDTFVAATASALYVIVGVYTTTGYTAYFNGVAAGTVSSGPSTGTTATLCVMDYNGGGFSYTGNVLGALAFNRALTAGEVGALGTPQAIFSLFQPAKLGIAMPASVTTDAATIAGTLGALATAAGGTQSSSAAATSGLGALISSASASLANSATTSSSLGSLATQATAAITAIAVAASTLGGISSSCVSTQSQTVSASSSLSLSTSASASQSQGASGSSTLGALSTSITAIEQTPGAAVISSALGSLASSGQTTQLRAASASSSLSLFSLASVTQSSNAVASSALGALSSSIIVLDIAADLATISGSLGALTSSGIANQTRSATAASALSLSTQIIASSSSQAVGSPTLGALQSAASFARSQSAIAGASLGALSTSISVVPPYTAVASGLLGHLSSSVTVTFGAPAYPINASYYARATPRPFYAQAPARLYWAKAPLRAFYVKIMPTLTTIPVLSQKGPLEVWVITLDATLLLATGETLTGTPSIVVSTQIGSDNPPSLTLANGIINSQAVTLINGVTVASGCAVQAVASAGQFASQYLISATVTTSNPNKTLTLEAVLPMRSQ